MRARDIGSAIGAGIVGLVCVGGAGLVVGLVLDIGGQDFLPSASAYLTISGAAVGAVGGVLYQSVGTAWDRARQREARHLAELMARERAAEGRRQMMERIYGEIGTSSRQAVAEFERLPDDLRAARSWAEEAARHFRDNAYSPYWTAVENAYGHLGEYNRRIGLIAQHAATYERAVASFLEKGGNAAVEPFPVELDAARATEAAEATAGALHEQVYQAQRDPVFAQIWEQRRTTAAVVAGFASLEGAIHSMTGALQASVGSLENSLGTLAVSMRGVEVAVATASAQAGAAQLGAQKELTARMDKAVFYLREEYKRGF